MPMSKAMSTSFQRLECPISVPLQELSCHLVKLRRLRKAAQKQKEQRQRSRLLFVATQAMDFDRRDVPFSGR